MLPPDDRRAESVRALLAQVVPANPFYARKFAGLDGTPLDGLPYTTKADLVADQADHPPYGSNLTFDRSRYCRLHQTSGTSSGQPLRWLDTQESWSWLVGCWRAIFDTAGLQRDDVVFFPFSFGPFLGFWTAFEAAAAFGCRVLPAGGLSSTARLRYLMDHGATVVCCTPTYALHLAELAAKEGIDLASSSVRLLIVAGEPGGSISATRERIEIVWGGRVVDHYGMTEVGPVAVETASEPRSMLVLEDRFVAEVIDPTTGLSCVEGEAGELVLTNLGRVGSPVIRYRTGDMVRPRRIDGRLYLDGGILGRTDDMLHVRGNNIYPAAIEAVVRRFPEVAEFRIIVDRSGPLADLAIEIEPRMPVAGLAEAVGRALRDELLFRVEVMEVASLPRFEMKARRVVSK